MTAMYTEQSVSSPQCQRTIARTLTGVRQLYLAGHCDEGEYRRRTLTFACGDANFRLANAQWKNRNKTVATGRAVVRANTGNPFCAAGHVVSYSVRVRA